MKKLNKKFYLAIIATILIASVSFAISCGKENRQKTKVLEQKESVLSTKSSTVWNSLKMALCEFNLACNNAYSNDSINFITICNNNDTTQFYVVTGLTHASVNNLYLLTQEAVNLFLSNNPTYEFNTEPCNQCMEEGLPWLGYALTLTHGHLPASIDDYHFPMDDTDCWMYCGRTTSDYLQFDACVSSCLSFLWYNQHSYPYE